MKQFILLVTFITFSVNTFAMRCFGTEPFWSAEVSGSTVKFEYLGDDKKLNMNITEVSSPLGMPNTDASYVRVYKDGKKLVAVVTANKCDDGMSENDYAKEIVLFYKESALFGCCDLISK